MRVLLLDMVSHRDEPNCLMSLILGLLLRGLVISYQFWPTLRLNSQGGCGEEVLFARGNCYWGKKREDGGPPKKGTPRGVTWRSMEAKGACQGGLPGLDSGALRESRASQVTTKTISTKQSETTRLSMSHIQTFSLNCDWPKSVVIG